MGTVAYMSPEQVRAKDLDARTDLFSFGVVLYEMATGQLPFRGESSGVIFKAILDKESVAPVRLNPDVPAKLEEIINKALEKNRNLRYQHASDIRTDLQRLKRDTDGRAVASRPTEEEPTGETSERPSSGKQKAVPASQLVIAEKPDTAAWKNWISVAVVVVLALLAGGSYWLHRGTETKTLRVVPLSTLPGEKLSPSFSPDGSQIAFAWNEDPNGAGFDLYAKVIGTEKPLRLTNRPAEWLDSAWSPDGRFIAVERFSAQDSGVYLISALGGPERKLVSFPTPDYYPAVMLSWSPGGHQLVYVDTGQSATSEDSLKLIQLSLDSLERRTIDTQCPRAIAPAFSPHGDFLAYVCMESYGIFSINLWRTSDGTIRRLFRGQGEADGIAWSDDGKHLAYSDPSADSSLWELELAHPDHPEKLPVGSGVSQVVGSALGKKLAYMKIWQNVNIWRLDLGSGEPRAHKLVTPTREQNNPSISPDGSKIAFESDRSGSREVRICDRDGSNATQVTSLAFRIREHRAGRPMADAAPSTRLARAAGTPLLSLNEVYCTHRGSSRPTLIF